MNLGLTQPEFAELIGYAVSTVSLWERDLHAPSKQARFLIDQRTNNAVRWPKEKE